MKISKLSFFTKLYFFPLCDPQVLNRLPQLNLSIWEGSPQEFFVATNPSCSRPPPPSSPTSQPWCFNRITDYKQRVDPNKCIILFWGIWFLFLLNWFWYFMLFLASSHFLFIILIFYIMGIKSVTTFSLFSTSHDSNSFLFFFFFYAWNTAIITADISIFYTFVKCNLSSICIRLKLMQIQMLGGGFFFFLFLFWSSDSHKQ